MHVLVHHLFTDTYQCLKPKATYKRGKIAEEFSTALRVYALAQRYDLSYLEELARAEIEKLSSELHFSMVLGLVQSAYPNPRAQDPWFINFLKTTLTSILQHPSEPECGLPIHAEQTSISVCDLLLRCLVELADDQIILLRDPDSTPEALDVPDTTEQVTFKMPIPQQGSPREIPAEPTGSGTEQPCDLEWSELKSSQHGPEHSPVFEHKSQSLKYDVLHECKAIPKDDGKSVCKLVPDDETVAIWEAEPACQPVLKPVPALGDSDPKAEELFKPLSKMEKKRRKKELQQAEREKATVMLLQQQPVPITAQFRLFEDKEDEEPVLTGTGELLQTRISGRTIYRPRDKQMER